jgi:hypothetical protein
MDSHIGSVQVVGKQELVITDQLELNASRPSRSREKRVPESEQFARGIGSSQRMT